MRAILKRLSGLALGLVMLSALAVQAGASPRGTAAYSPQQFRVLVVRHHRYYHDRYWYYHHHHWHHWHHWHQWR